ncbi:MAG: hypothetical protein ACLFVA_01585, partial [Dehalococcoidia bacterium]
DLGGAELRFDFLDEIFGDFLKGTGFPLSFRSFGGRPGRIRFETCRDNRSISMEYLHGPEDLRIFIMS